MTPENDNVENVPVDQDTIDQAIKNGQGDNIDNNVDAQEAQNVNDSGERLSGEEAEKATRKANS